MNKKISTIIVDDESLSIESLSKDLEKYKEIEITETFTSAEKAKTVILKQQPDLLFINVEMPYKSGIELLKELGKEIHTNISVVFCSVYRKYTIEAIRVSAFDYLLKPYKPEELDGIIKRVKEKLKFNNMHFEQSVKKLLSDNTKFALQTTKALLFLSCSDIIYFTYDSKCWNVTIKENTGSHKLKTKIKPTDILKLGKCFYQISQNCIINIMYLHSIKNGTRQCIFHSPYENLNFTISKQYYPLIKDALEML